MGRNQNETALANVSQVWRPNFLISQRGVSLVELVATVSILAIIALGSTFLFSDLAKVQKRSAVANSIATMRSNIIQAINQTQVNPAAVTPWNVSRDDAAAGTGNPEMACLRANTPCTKDVALPLNLKSFDGTELFYSRAATRGFDLDGRLCNTFSLTAGSPVCPFRWVMLWTARCVGADKPTCDNPTIEVTGRLEYSPGNTEVLGNTPFNPNVYDFNIKRGEKRNLNEPVVIAYIEDDATGEAGSCHLTWHPRQLNRIIRDPGTNATLVGGTGFSLLPGAYDCRIQVPAFKNGGNQIRLVRTVGSVSAVQATSGTVTASMTGESATVMLSASFSSVGAAVFTVQHTCSNRPSLQVPPSGAGDAFMLGVPAPGLDLAVAPTNEYFGTTYTKINCVKTSGL